MDDDPIWRCPDPTCGVCALMQRSGESRADWLARVGALYRAAPPHPNQGRRPEPTVRACSVCGETFQAVSATACRSRCRNRLARQRKKATRMAG